MSTLSDSVELEAAIAEAELDDDEAERVKDRVGEGLAIAEAIAIELAVRAGSEALDAEPIVPPAELGEPTDDQLRKLDNEQRRHENRVREIMGAHVAGFDACDHCGGVGLVPPGPRPQTHENYKACDTCNGFGRVLTGSQRPGNEDVDCPSCRGRGYLERLTESGQPVVPATPSAAAIAPAPVAPVALEQADLNGGKQGDEVWGVPAWMGDPNLGS